MGAKEVLTKNARRRAKEKANKAAKAVAAETASASAADPADEATADATDDEPITVEYVSAKYSARQPAYRRTRRAPNRSDGVTMRNGRAGHAAAAAAVRPSRRASSSSVVCGGGPIDLERLVSPRTHLTSRVTRASSRDVGVSRSARLATPSRESLWTLRVMKMRACVRTSKPLSSCGSRV